jgi:uncharacterized membrane protein
MRAEHYRITELMMESKARTGAKTVSWLTITITIAVLLVGAMTGRWMEVIVGNLILAVIFTPLFALHERIWLKVKWGMSDD